ncbi:MAG: AlpA family phage regulatory protein [Hyphomonadaceae bacterium]|nr:AlpA family phage regulatory protein [Hyphomonadaceae bacterium]
MSNAALEKAYAYAAELQAAAAANALPRYIRRHELRQVVPVADTTIYEMEQRGDFPKRFYLTSRCPVWDLSEVEAWIKQRRAEADSDKTKSGAPDVRKRKRRPVRKT